LVRRRSPFSSAKNHGGRDTSRLTRRRMPAVPPSLPWHLFFQTFPRCLFPSIEAPHRTNFIHARRRLRLNSPSCGTRILVPRRYTLPWRGREVITSPPPLDRMPKGHKRRRPLASGSRPVSVLALILCYCMYTEAAGSLFATPRHHRPPSLAAFGTPPPPRPSVAAPGEIPGTPPSSSLPATLSCNAAR